ncbi:MAG: nickel permease [Cyanobacteria bacterium REEB65]|nr:nickel permease [Cyanobacteria bacterium REEB65]
MLADLISVAGLLLAFTLGLRHGLDPDHISAVDGMTMRSFEEGRPVAPWVGTLFAGGHGAVVTAVAAAVALLSTEIHLPDRLLSVAEWIPIVLLVLVGSLNLVSLTQAEKFQLQGWKSLLLPRALRNSTSPLAVVLVGVIFAVAFDTATQAMAWGYAATAHGGPWAALIVGVAFTIGMMTTDSIDSRLLCSVMRRAGHVAGAERYRRTIGWAVVSLSFGVAAYGVLTRCMPQAELGGIATSVVGFVLVASLACCLASLRGKPAAA